MTAPLQSKIERWQRADTRAAVLLAVLVFLGVLAFSSRPVYSDEPIFLRLARSALDNPMFPADTPALFFGIELDDYASHTHPPVGEYYLALVTWLVPEFDETVYRILFSVFPVMTIVAFYALARRFTRAPFAISLLLAVSPAFFVMSPTLMMDIPMLAFLLAGFALFFDHTDGMPHRLAPAAACFALAAGTGYTALVPLGCLGIWCLASRPRRRELLALASAPAVLGLWLLAMTAHFGRFPLNDTFAFFAAQPRSLAGNVAATFSFLGGVTLFPWSAPFLMSRDGVPRRALIAGSVAAAAGLALWVDGGPLYRLWFATLAAAGAFLVAGAAWNAWRGRAAGEENWQRGFLLTWLLATLLFFIVVGDMSNARYLLLAMPPLYLLLFDRIRPPRMPAVVALTSGLAIVVAVADYRSFAGYRAWVEETVVPLEQQGFRVWGAVESTLRFYLEQSGAATLGADDLAPRGGDFIVRDAYGYGLAEELSVVLVHVLHDVLADPFPVRTFNAVSGAGLHDSRFGLVPYTWSTAPHDELDLVQLSPLVEELPQPGEPGRPEAVWSAEGPVLIQTEDALRIRFDAPPGTELRYELEGNGTARMEDGIIELIRESPDPIVWRNLHVVPENFP